MFRHYFRQRGSFVATFVAIIALVFIIDTGLRAFSQNQRKQEIQQNNSYQRPSPSRPIQPEIPSANRYQEDKVFLEYADSLYKITQRWDTIERQILKGNVKFRQAGLWMFCDSAYYYPERNSLDAFSNVRMEQGDTLFVYADKLFYNGDEHLAKLKNGPTRDKVKLINKDVTLTTDSLDYNTAIELGWYVKWGTIDDKVNTLTSLYGEYSPRTKEAEFIKDVVLVNNKDGYTLLTDTLYYSTETHIADIVSKTEIQSANDTIITHLAKYYTDTGDADLLSRSTILHRDSTGNVTTLEGDSIIYDNETRISRAYMFRDPFKNSKPMVITDTAQKTTLIGGFGIYNDSTKEALATIYPLLMEYSTEDTLFLRADVIKTFLVTEMVPKKQKKTKSGFPEYNEVPILKIDSTGVWYDTTFFASKIPLIDQPIRMLKEAAPPAKPKEEKIEIMPQGAESLIPDKTDAFMRREDTPEEALSSLEGQVHDNVESALEREIHILEADSVYKETELVPAGINKEKVTIEGSGDSGIDENQGVRNVSGEMSDSIVRGDSIRMFDVMPGMDSLHASGANQPTDSVDSEIEKVDSVPYEYHIIIAYHRGRFFKQDMQGVADSMVFVERDSMLYMFRKPIIWNGERQVTGNRIDVHFNDSTTDWAYLPEYGMMSEHVDEDFYNQIYGKEITTYFENQGLRRMSVSGNVETIFLPQEEDSTYNRLVNAESSYMEVYMDSNKLDWLKMWPEVSGTVTPLFLIKRSQMYLQKFKWWNFLRPEREWYGNRLHWADNLGEVPEVLEQYFLAPSDFGEPKSFSGTRVELPPSSLPIWEQYLPVDFRDTLNRQETELIDTLQKLPLGVPLEEKSETLTPEEENLTLSDIEESEKETEEENEETLEQSEMILKKEKEGVESEDFEGEEENKEPANNDSEVSNDTETDGNVTGNIIVISED